MPKRYMSKTPWERCVYPVLKEALEATGFNQTRLAEALQTTQSTVTQWMIGDREQTIMLLLRLEDLTGKSFRELFAGADIRRGEK